MKSLIMVVLPIFVTAGFLACSPASTSTSGSQDPNMGCQQGTTYTGVGCQAFNGQIMQGAVSFDSNSFHDNDLTIVNPTVYLQFLQQTMSLCTSNYSNSGMSFGEVDCNNPSSIPLNMTLNAPTNTSSLAQVSFEVGTQTTAVISNTAGNVPNHMTATMSIALANNNQGIVGIAGGSDSATPYGMNGITAPLQLRVSNQRLSSSFMDYELSFNGAQGGVFAKGRMILCKNTTCSQ